MDLLTLPDQETLRQLFDYNPNTGVLKYRDKRQRRRRSKKSKGNDYLKVRVGGKSVRAHRVIWIFFHGYEPEFIDHIDGNRQNNKIENLRSVSKSGNGQNMKLKQTNTTGVYGVSKHGRRWRAYINLYKKQRSIGAFDTFDEAVSARQVVEKWAGYHENHGRP